MRRVSLWMLVLSALLGYVVIGVAYSQVLRHIWRLGAL